MHLDLDTLLHFLGRLHPITVHFPIALLVVAGLLELPRMKAREPSSPAVVCLVFGALGAVAAASFGWLYAAHDAASGDATDLFRHRWSGVATAALAVFALVSAHLVRASRGGASRQRCLLGYRVGLLLSLGLVVYGSHLGGKMVYGEGFLLDVLLVESEESTEVAPALSGSGEEVPVPDPAPLEQGVDFVADVLPIYEASCFKCHGAAGRAKAGLRLHDPALLFDGPEEDWLVRPGDAAASLLFQLISLPADHEDGMPAAGDPLSASQIELIGRWIDEGAQWNPADVPATEPAAADAPSEGPSDAAPVVADSPVVIESRGAVEPGDALAAIRAFGAHAGRVAEETEDVDVNLGVAGARVSDDALALLSGLEPVLVWLDLSRSSVTDAGVARLAGFPRLQRLRLDRTEIGDEALATVGTLVELELLNLVGTSVTDAGLAQLTSLPRLRKLFLWETAVTPEGAAALRVALPELELELGGERSDQ